MSARCSRQQGFSLVEVLIALIIISTGLLGIIGLQTYTQKVSSNAYFQTQSIIITHDMAEKTRANPIASYQKQYHLKRPFQSDNCHKQAGCSPYTMAKNDLFEWHEIINQQLPQGLGVVCIDSTPNDGKPNFPACDNQGTYYAIKLWWHDSSVNKILRSVMKVSSE